MYREIFCNNTTLKYKLTYKNVKNINLRIKADGTINVSASKRVPQAIIDEFVISKSEFIFKALERFKNVLTSPKKQYFTEDDVKLVILNLCDKVYPYFQARGVNRPQIKFRKMVSCWGNCNSSKGIITFSTNLIFAPIECIEYVVQHEFTHLLQPNHSDKFYIELSKICPDWKELRKNLKEIHIR